MSFVVVLDTSTIFSSSLRDTLLRAAESGLYRLVLSKDIVDELGRVLKRHYGHIDPSKFDRLAETIVDAFPEAIVEGYEELIPAMRNHEGDRHVLAAAVRAGAALIVTNNSEHFPASACAPYDIDVQTPDEFLCHLWHLSPGAMQRILLDQAEALRNPPQTVTQVIETLSRSVPRFADIALSSLVDPGD